MWGGWKECVGCLLEAFKYLRASKKHGTFVTPGMCVFFFGEGGSEWLGKLK